MTEQVMHMPFSLASLYLCASLTAILNSQVKQSAERDINFVHGDASRLVKGQKLESQVSDVFFCRNSR